MTTMHKTSVNKTQAWQDKVATHTYIDNLNSAVRIANIEFDRLCLKVLRPEWNILDLGCGTGETTFHLIDHGYKPVSCDASAEMLNRLKELKGRRKVDLRHGSGFEIPAEESEFDAVISRTFIAHFPDWQNILKDVHRVLKPGGIYMYDFFNREHYEYAQKQGTYRGDDLGCSHDENALNHRASVSLNELKSITDECGFDIVDVIPQDYFGPNAILNARESSEEFNEQKTKLQEFLKNDKVKEFVLWYDENIASRLPVELTIRNTTILRKR